MESDFKISLIIVADKTPHELDATLCSVQSQGYPGLECFVVILDGTDEYRERLESEEDWIAWWGKSPRHTVPAALNLALDKATGDAIGYLRAGDELLSKSLRTVSESFQKRRTDFLYGACRLLDESGATTRVHLGRIFSLEDLLDLWNVWWTDRRFYQPECFWSRRMFLKVRSFRDDLSEAYAYEYWTRLFQAGAKIERVEKELVSHHLPTATLKCQSERTRAEELSVLEPILWNPSVPIDPVMRRHFQADWLFQRVLLPDLEESRERNESSLARKFRLGKTIARHPKILVSEQFQRYRNPAN